MENTDEILKKIKKLLSLATSSNENEAKVAAGKAQELMVKYNLDIQSVSKAQFEYNEVGVGKASSVQRQHTLILGLLVDHFFVKSIVVTKGIKYDENGKKVPNKEFKLIGTQVNVIVAQYVYDYLQEVYTRLWKEFKKENGLTERYKYSYILGITRGIHAKLKEVKQRVQDEKGMVLVKDPELDKLTEGVPLRKSKALEISNRVASKGYEDGLKVHIARAIESDKSNNGLVLDYKEKG